MRPKREEPVADDQDIVVEDDGSFSLSAPVAWPPRWEDGHPSRRAYEREGQERVDYDNWLSIEKDPPDLDDALEEYGY